MLNKEELAMSISTQLQEMGFTSAAVTPGVVEYADFSPSPRPTGSPTMTVAVLQTTQRIAGITTTDVMKVDFQVAMEKGVLESLGLSGAEVEFESFSKSAFGEAIDVVYSVSVPSVTYAALNAAITLAAKSTGSLRGEGKINDYHWVEEEDIW